MTNPDWLKKPPAGSVWLVEDTLTQLVRAGVDIGGPVKTATTELLDQAQAIHDNERLWRRVPSRIGTMSREALRTRLNSALGGCRGFN